MAATKIFDLAVKTSEYQDNTGAKKGRYQNVGAIMQSDDGSQFIMLAKWFNPAGVADLTGRGGESLLISCFAPKDREQAAPQQQQRQAAPAQQQRPAPAAAAAQDFDDDISF